MLNSAAFTCQGLWHAVLHIVWGSALEGDGATAHILSNTLQQIAHSGHSRRHSGAGDLPHRLLH